MAMSTEELHSVMNILHDNDVVPALSCGMKASLVQPIVDEFGVDWMANVGGSIHSDPEGTYVGTQKMRAACDAVVVK
jgi:ribulose 1,5-bisphosphate carboxylase large subunit-like protein